MRRVHIILCCFLSVLVLTAEGQQISLSGRQDVAKLAPQLALQLRDSNPAVQAKAVETLHQIAGGPRVLSDNLVSWLDPLLQTGRYDDVLNLTAIAINDRAFDISPIEKFQEARVQALIGQGKLDEALSESKAYYNICVLKNTTHAIDLICSILEHQGKATVAARLRAEQTRAAPTTEPSVEPLEPGLPLGATVLSWIKTDPTPWQEMINNLANGGHTFNDYMKDGNLLLLADQPQIARKSFEAACGEVDSSNGKNIREAVEGIARCIRDMPGGSPTLANNFITNLRNSPEIAGIGLVASVPENRLKAAAQQTVLAPVQNAAFPALEQRRSQDENKSRFSATDVIKVTTKFETATPISTRLLSPTHYELTLIDSLIQGWFMFRVENVKGKTIRIDIKNRYGPLDNWSTFNPVYSYITDLSDPASYSTSAPAGKAMPMAAWNGSGALLPDTSGQKWRYVPDVWPVDANTMAFVMKFDEDQAYISMRVPYPPSCNERYLKSLPSESEAQLIEVAKSKQGKPLLMAKIGNGDEKTKPCILLYAGEHADEYDGMWTARGAIEFLLSDKPPAGQFRNQFTFLIIPQLDPDASAIGHHEGMYRGFVTDEQKPETVAYSNWFQNWINTGNRLDLVFDFHNVQSRESGHVACALIEELGLRGELSLNLHKLLYEDFEAQKLNINPRPWEHGWSPDRLGGWLARRYGPICLAYELNSQAAERHLTLQELKDLGAIFVQGTGEFLAGNNGAKLLANVDMKRSERQGRWVRADGVDPKLDAIAAEAKVSYGVGRNTGSSSPKAEKWVP